MNERKALEEIYWAAIRAVDPRAAVSSQVDYISRQFERTQFRRLVPLAFGKAACLMTQGLSDLHDFLSPGIVVTKHGQCASAAMPRGLKIIEAGHPVPDRNSLAAARTVMEFAQQQGSDTVVVCLISGGGSSLLAMPANGISFEEKQRLVDLLLKAGVTIDELNCVRKHISEIKGGRLAELLYPATVVSLIISDVLGDKIDVIASGPTAPDSSTFGEAYEVITRYGLTRQVPASVVRLLQNGVQGMAPETPKEGDPIFERVENRVIINNDTALKAAAEKARTLGFHTRVLPSPVRGEARVAGKELAKGIVGHEMSRPVCLLSGGETTVSVRGQGKGGRNMELALGFVQTIQEAPPVHLLSAGTDGDDNSTGAAGAFADGTTLKRAHALGLDVSHSLNDNDSYAIFRELGDLFVTGPTGTNVMDIQILLLGPASEHSSV